MTIATIGVNSEIKYLSLPEYQVGQFVQYETDTDCDIQENYHHNI